MPEKEDRIIFCSDGVAQSGMGGEAFPFGWGRDDIADYASSLVQAKHRFLPSCSQARL